MVYDVVLCEQEENISQQMVNRQELQQRKEPFVATDVIITWSRCTDLTVHPSVGSIDCSVNNCVGTVITHITIHVTWCWIPGYYIILDLRSAYNIPKKYSYTDMYLSSSGLYFSWICLQSVFHRKRSLSGARREIFSRFETQTKIRGWKTLSSAQALLKFRKAIKHFQFV